jgi:hypothetical protein
MNTNVRVERRKNKRFQVHSGAFVILRPSDTCVGRIIDIGIDGLAFEYVDGEKPPGRPDELEIFVSNSVFRLKNLPCQSIYDLTIYESPLSSLNKKRCGVQFGKLTSRQKAKLSYFIEHHTAGAVSPRTNKSISDFQRPDINDERVLQIDEAEKEYLENLMNNRSRSCRRPKKETENPCKAEDVGLGNFVKCLKQNPFGCHLSVSFVNSWYCACPSAVYLSSRLRK